MRRLLFMIMVVVLSLPLLARDIARDSVKVAKRQAAVSHLKQHYKF